MHILYRDFLIFCSVPLSQPNRGNWIRAIAKFQSFDYAVQTFHICSRHFLSSDIKTNGKRKTVISGKVPSIFPDLAETDNFENDRVGDTIEVNTDVQSLSSLHQNETPYGNETWYFAENDFDLTDETNVPLLNQDPYDSNSE